MKFPDSWIEVRLADACALNPRLPSDARPDEMTEVTFVSMSAVDEISGTISKPEIRTFGEVSKGYTSFLENDVLFAKVTPCMENGKAAIAGVLANGLGFGSTEFHVLRPTELVHSEYIFHFVRQKAFRDRAASAFVGTGGLQRVPPEFLSRIKLPLPSLPEQQRIVDVLRQVEGVAKLRSEFDELLARTKRQLFVEMFGDPNPKFNSQWPVVKLGTCVSVGTGGTPSREQSDSYGGKLAWVKSTDLKDDAITSTEEHVSELGIQRSNAKTYPTQTVMLAMYGQGQTRGRTGKLLIEAACNQACAALLQSDELLPDYLWVWLQLSYESVRSLGRGGQQENLNLDIVRGIKIPKPPAPLQQEFSRRLTALLDAVKESRRSGSSMATLLEVLQVEALAGDATSAWREQHTSEIAAAAEERDALLRERGAKLVTRSPEPAPLTLVAKDYQRPARQWLLAELSEFQRQVLAAFSAYPEQPLLVEDADVFARFCDDENVLELLKNFGPSLNSRIRRTLSQLSSLGLIAKLTLPKQNPQTGERDYLKAFRPLREDEYTKMADVEALRRALSSSDAAVRHYFTVVLDYETSEHAGAGGMFQVAALSDEDDKDRTDLVGQGKHYAALDEVANDIARRLGVRADQIELEE
jgi:type I restriction enzyme S subunit